MRQNIFFSKAFGRAAASRRIVLATLCATALLVTLAGAANPAGQERPSSDPIQFSATLELGSFARLTVRVIWSSRNTRSAVSSTFASEAGLSLRLTLAPGIQPNISYNTSGKEQTP